MTSPMEELFGPIEAAVYETVHSFVDAASQRRGAVALAPRLGMQAGTLSNKANPTMVEHKLGLSESITLQVAAADMRILHAYAAALGHCAMPLPTPRDASDVELLDAYAEVNERCGAKAKAIRDALRDGHITTAEVGEIRARFHDEIRAGMELLSRLESLAR
jgi:hypothetical protein